MAEGFGNDTFDEGAGSTNPAGALNAFEIHNFQAAALQNVGSVNPAAAYQIAGVGDFNNDGTDDVLFYKGDGGIHAFQVANFTATSWQGVGGVTTDWHVV